MNLRIWEVKSDLVVKQWYKEHMFSTDGTSNLGSCNKMLLLIVYKEKKLYSALSQ